MSELSQKLLIRGGGIIAGLIIGAFILLGAYGIDTAINGAAGGDECEAKGGVYVQSVCIDRDAVIELD